MMSNKENVVEEASIEEKAAYHEGETEEDPFTEAETRKLIHKIDRRLLTVCGSLVAISLLDRGNLSNAYIAG